MPTTDDVLAPVRLRDIPALALIVGQAMGRQPFGVTLAWALAVVSWPFWWATLTVQHPHLWHARYRCVVAIRPPGMRTWPGLRLFLLGPGLLGALVATSWTEARPLYWALLAGVGAGLIVSAGHYRGRLRAGAQYEHPKPPVVIATAASIRRGSGLLDKTRALLRARHPGAALELVARDSDLVRLYAERLGVHQVAPGKGRMVGEVPR